MIQNSKKLLSSRLKIRTQSTRNKYFALLIQLKRKNLV